jgi:hypothetical protein
MYPCSIQKAQSDGIAIESSRPYSSPDRSATLAATDVTREMIELLTLGKRYGWDRLQQVVEQSLALGCTDAAAVRHLLTATELSRPRNELLELNGLERYERPLPLMNEYDQLLSIAASTAEVAR